MFSGSYLGVRRRKIEQERASTVGLECRRSSRPTYPARAGLRSENRSLGIGSPLYYRRIEVGQVVSFALDPDGRGVTLQVFVNAPYDQYVTSNTRFWHASGVDIPLDATGVKVDTASLAAIIAGGIAFQAPPDLPPAEPAAAETTFNLVSDRATAMRHTDTEVLTMQLYFAESLRGLLPGAPIDFHGITLGEVKSVDLEFDAESERFRFPVVIDLHPDRLRSKVRGGMHARRPKPGRAPTRRSVAQGLRAQLRTGKSLLTGQLYIALDFFRRQRRRSSTGINRRRSCRRLRHVRRTAAMVGGLTKNSTRFRSSRSRKNWKASLAGCSNAAEAPRR